MFAPWNATCANLRHSRCTCVGGHKETATGFTPDGLARSSLTRGVPLARTAGAGQPPRRLAARHYAATIAAGVVRHGCWITRQRPDRRLSALQDLAADDAMDDSLRSIASEAIAIANDRLIEQDS